MKSSEIPPSESRISLKGLVAAGTGITLGVLSFWVSIIDFFIQHLHI